MFCNFKGNLTGQRVGLGGQAPNPEEFKSFHNLRLLIKPYLFTVKQAKAILEVLGTYAALVQHLSMLPIPDIAPD
jgi:hypothetical protein